MRAHRRYADVTSMDDVLRPASAVIQADAFEILFNSQFPRLARLVRRVVRDSAEAEDIAANTLWKCFRIQPADLHLEGWLSRVAIRAALDGVRRKARRARYESLWSWTRPVAEPDELFARDREAERVRHVLARLNTRSATLLVLRTEGLDYRAMANVIGVQPSSVGTLLARAETHFRKEYVKRYGHY